MKINIFGVGRSGTKAIQLWLTYLLITHNKTENTQTKHTQTEKNKTAWVNYEPFCYRNKSLTPTQRGRLLHQASPLFMAAGCETSQGFEAFCRHLADHDMVVTKFIRGNGRMTRINELMRPDRSILVVRGLYDVLNSVALQDWNLVENRHEWQRLCQFSRAHYPFLADFGLLETSGVNKITRSAVYWFVMNMVALADLRDTLAVDFSDRAQLEALPAYCGLNVSVSAAAEPSPVPGTGQGPAPSTAPGPALSDPIFRGNNIHSPYPLEEISPGNPHRLLGTQAELLRKLPPKLHKLVAGSSEGVMAQVQALMLSNPIVSNETMGTCCQVNTAPKAASKVAPTTTFNVRTKIVACPVLDELSARVSQAMSQVQGQPSDDQTRQDQQVEERR